MRESDFKVPLPMFSGRNDDWPVVSKVRSVRRVGRLDRCARGGGSADCADLDGWNIS